MSAPTKQPADAGANHLHASRKALTGLATAAAGAGGAAVKLGDEGLLAAGGGPAGEFFSCCSRQLANCCASRCDTSCMIAERPNCATSPLTATSDCIVTTVRPPSACISLCTVAAAPPRPRDSTPSAFRLTV